MPDPPKKRYEMDPKILQKEKDLAKLEEAIATSTGPLATLIFPFQVYVFFLMFNHPAGWFLMNLLIPLKAHYEYSEIHGSILKYVLHQDEHEKRELK